MARAHENNQPTIQDGGPNEDWGLNEERKGSTRPGDRAGPYVSLSGRGRRPTFLFFRPHSSSLCSVPPNEIRVYFPPFLGKLQMWAERNR